MKPITFVSVAEAELADALRFYEAAEEGLGGRFLHEVQRQMTLIQQAPDRWACFERPVRSRKVGPFPYCLLYRERHDRIQILAVMHLSRRPAYWHNRQT